MAEKTPGEVRSTERLMHYWAEGKGRSKINWGVPGDFDRCVVELGKYVGPGIVKGLCANLHKRATGGWPGHAPGIEEAEAKAKHKGLRLVGRYSLPGSGRVLFAIALMRIGG